jgi:hypothetical protein
VVWGLQVLTLEGRWMRYAARLEVLWHQPLVTYPTSSRCISQQRKQLCCQRKWHLLGSVVLEQGHYQPAYCQCVVAAHGGSGRGGKRVARESVQQASQVCSSSLFAHCRTGISRYTGKWRACVLRVLQLLASDRDAPPCVAM